jgi:hypothetical protein
VRYSAVNSTDAVNFGALYDGALISMADVPLTLIVGGVRLQWAVAAPAGRLSRNSYTVTSTVFYGIPYGASVYEGNLAIYAQGRPGGFVLDDKRLWPVSCIDVISDNGSQLKEVSTAEYDSYAIGPALFCV